MPEQSPLHDVTVRSGAEFLEEAGWALPARFGNVDGEYQAAKSQAALFDVSHRSKVELSGPEAVSFLQNLCTNDADALPIGAGCETFLTTMHAKVLAYALVYHLFL